MHRSGTSLLTNILTALGLFTGDKADKDSNHETRLLITCNERLLKKFGASWDRPLPFLDKIKDPKMFKQAVQLLKNLLQERQFEVEKFLGKEYSDQKSLYNLDILWGAKDPRLTFTIDIWAELFPNCKIININRHGVDVAKSLYNRQNKVLEVIKKKHSIKKFKGDMIFKTGLVEHTMRCMSTEGAFELWVEYMDAAEKQVNNFGNRSLSITYENLLKSPVDITSKLIEYCGLTPSDNDIQNAISLMSSGNFDKYKNAPKLITFANDKQSDLKKFRY